MSKTRNIGGDNADASYRYKMPQLVTKVEGRGNGIKTVLVNMTDIAKSLCCDPAYPTKYFGFTLGTQSKYSQDIERAVVNGQHDQPDLEKILDKFVEQFILCPTCKLPEIAMKVKKGSTISIDCAACGHNSNLVSKMPKMVAYICKNPPGSNSKGADEPKESKKKKKKKNKKESNDTEEKEVAELVEEVEEVTLLTDTSKEAQEQRKREEFAGASGAVEVKKSKKSKKKKEEAIPDGPGQLMKLFCESNPNARTKQIVDELSRIQLARTLDDTAKLKVLLEGILDLSEPKSVAGQLEKYKRVLKKVVNTVGLQLLFIYCMEEVVGVIETKLLKRTSILLKTLFDEGVLGEDVILQWACSPPESSYLVPKTVAASIRKAAAPFIEWLEEESSESDEESEESA